MNRLQKIFLVVVVAGVCSIPLMLLLHFVVAPNGDSVRGTSAYSLVGSFALFALATCACAGLATAVGLYFRQYSVVVRWVLVLPPMLLAGVFATVHIGMAISRNGVAFIAAPSIYLEDLALHTIPWSSFVVGLLVGAVAWVVRKPRGQPTAGGNAASPRVSA